LGRRTVDLSSGVVTAGAETTQLTPRETRLMRYLVERIGRPVPREELLTEVWSYQPSVVTRTIDNTVRRLRLKLEDNASDPRFLRALYGRGLMLEGVEIIDANPHRSALVGREEALARALSLLQTERLVTITGPAGIGKSRLAEEVQGRLREAVAVSCASVRTAEELDQQVRAALETQEWVTDALFARSPLVLLLDQCEEVTEIVAQRVTYWLTRVGGLRVLLTSRIVLDLPSEHRLVLGPLPEQAALALFQGRLVRHDPRFPLQQPALQRIVSLLDGLPLAIELAAARAPLLGLEKLEALLQAPLEALQSRGRSMADVLERSWRLCSLEDKRILAQLSVFASSFDLDDMSAITELHPAEALHAVESLASQSLISLVEGPWVRYRLLAAIRERARRALPDDDPVHLIYAQHFARLGAPEYIERARFDFTLRAQIRAAIPELPHVLERLLPDHPEQAAQCVLVWLWYLVREGGRGEGLDLPARLPQRPADARVAAGIAHELSVLLTGATRYAEAVAVLEEVLPRCTEPMDLVLLYTALAGARGNLGDTAGVEAAFAEAEVHLGSSRGAKPRFLFVRALFCSDPERIERLLAESIQSADEWGERLVSALATSELVERTHLQRGDWPAARRAYQQVLAQLGPRSDWPVVRMPARQLLIYLGRLEQLVGDLDAAEGYLEQALEIPSVDTSVVARVLLARVWSQRGQHDEALALIEPLTSGTARSAAEPLALSYIAHAECLLRAERWVLVPPLLERAELLVVQGNWPHLRAELSDLQAVVELREELLDQAASVDPTALGEARRRALRAFIATKHKDTARAQAELAQARAQLLRLELRPESDAVQWAERAARALRSRG
jgi:predicted ATPase